MTEALYRCIVKDEDGTPIQPWTLPPQDGSYGSAKAAQRAWNSSLPSLYSLSDSEEQVTYIVAEIQILEHHGWRFV